MSPAIIGLDGSKEFSNAHFNMKQCRGGDCDAAFID
jgi:hypothetical protein